MDEENTMEQAIRRLLYAMFDDFPERMQGKALRLLAAVVEAHEAELDIVQGELAEAREERDKALEQLQAARDEAAEHRRHVSTIMSREAALKREVNAARGIDPDAWKTPLEMNTPLGANFVFIAQENTQDYGIRLCYGNGRNETFWFRPTELAKAIPHMASFAAAHGEHVGTPRKPVDVEALAKAMRAAYIESLGVTVIGVELDQFLSYARAAIAHLGLEEKK